MIHYSFPRFRSHQLSRVTALVLEAFVVRLFREKNKKGFVKAFTDQPEHITSGLSPLKNIMKELQIRNVHIYPRFVERRFDCSR
jgi:DNA excision repair protein ERCC-4